MAQTYTRDRFRPRIRRLPPWQGAIILAGACAMAVALVVLVTGLSLVLIPAILVGVVAYRVFGRGRAGVPHRNPDIIDGEYVVLSDDSSGVKTSSLKEGRRDR